jgi:DNA-binding transcriptional LysR family regulator
MIQAGATPKELQVVLGHTSTGFILTQYGHVFDADLDRVVDRLDALLDPSTGHRRGKAGGTLVQIPMRKAE